MKVFSDEGRALVKIDEDLALASEPRRGGEWVATLLEKTGNGDAEAVAPPWSVKRPVSERHRTRDREVIDALEAQGVEDPEAVFREAQVEIKKAEQEVLENVEEKSGGDGKDYENQATEVVNIATELGELYRDLDDDAPLISLKLENGARRLVRVTTPRFKNIVAKEFYERHGKAPNNDALTAARNVLGGKALDRPGVELHNRVAGSLRDRVILHDCANQDWEAVKITPSEWEVIPLETPTFRRYQHQQPLTRPEENGDFERLLDYINVSSNGSTDESLLVMAAVASYLIPNRPRPVTVFYGPHGSAKTTAAKIVRRVIDPSAMDTLTFPHRKDTGELVQKLAHNHVANFDNVSYLNREQSDALCRAVTGEGFSKRKLYTDEEDVIFNYQRCIVLTGIDRHRTSRTSWTAP